MDRHHVDQHFRIYYIFGLRPGDYRWSHLTFGIFPPPYEFISIFVYFKSIFYQNRWCRNQSRHFDQFQRKNKGNHRNYCNRKMTKEKIGTGPADWKQGPSIWRWLGVLYFISILLTAKTIIVCVLSSVHVLSPPQTITLSSGFRVNKFCPTPHPLHLDSVKYTYIG